MAAFADVRKQEIERGVTLAGPHRDDLVIRLGRLPAKGYASHGESWSCALALRGLVRPAARRTLGAAAGPAPAGDPRAPGRPPRSRRPPEAGARRESRAGAGRRLRRAGRTPPRAAGGAGRTGRAGAGHGRGGGRRAGRAGGTRGTRSRKARWRADEREHTPRRAATSEGPPPRDGAQPFDSLLESTQGAQGAPSPQPPAEARTGIDLARVALRAAKEQARARGAAAQQKKQARQGRPALGRARRRPRPAPARRGHQPADHRPGWEAPAAVGGVMGRWPQIVGEDLAHHCTPLSYRTIRTSGC